MDCQRCYREVSGCEITIVFPLTLEITSQHVESSPDRDWIECEACGQIVCFHCCRHPASNFCDACIEKFNLTAELTELGLIPEDTVWSLNQKPKTRSLTT